MTLLDKRAPHTCYVQNRVMKRTERGTQTFVPDGEPVPVKCMVEPVRDWSSAEESVTVLGLQVTDLAIVRARTWPGNIHSHVTYDGALYETVGSPQHHHASRRTRHYRITLKWIKDVPTVTPPGSDTPTEPPVDPIDPAPADSTVPVPETEAP